MSLSNQLSGEPTTDTPVYIQIPSATSQLVRRHSQRNPTPERHNDGYSATSQNLAHTSPAFQRKPGKIQRI